MQLLPRKGQGQGAWLSIGSRESDRMPSRSYGLDLDAQRMRGYVDGEEALKQAVTRRLLTWWRAHGIYDDHYGFEAQGLVGRSKGYIKSELKRRLRECLLEDERIYDVESFRFGEGEEGDSWQLAFRLKSCFGEWEMEGIEVNRP